jgi:hypothetical protein
VGRGRMVRTKVMPPELMPPEPHVQGSQAHAARRSMPPGRATNNWRARSQDDFSSAAAKSGVGSGQKKDEGNRVQTNAARAPHKPEESRSCRACGGVSRPPNTSQRRRPLINRERFTIPCTDGLAPGDLILWREDVDVGRRPGQDANSIGHRLNSGMVFWANWDAARSEVIYRLLVFRSEADCGPTIPPHTFVYRRAGSLPPVAEILRKPWIEEDDRQPMRCQMDRSIAVDKRAAARRRHRGRS